MKTPNKHEIKFISDKFGDSAISIYAGQSAFFLMLSFVPFLMFFFALLNRTVLTEKDFLDWVASAIPESFHEVIFSYADRIFQSSTSTLTLTIISALWLSSKALVNVQLGLDSMYGLRETRNFILRRIYAVFYSAVLAIMMIVVLAVMVFGTDMRNRFLPDFGFLDELINIRVIIIIPVLFVFFWIMFSILPNGYSKHTQQIPGAIFSACGWVGFSWLFSIYVNKFCNYASIYGAMTTIALIMLWLYACMYILFLGGFINSVFFVEFLPNESWISKFHGYKKAHEGIILEQEDSHEK